MKIKIKELCDRLNSNGEEKWVFFKSLDNPIFLKPLFENNVLTFNDGGTSMIIKYLLTVFNDDTKELIIQIINKNIAEKTIENNRTHIIIKLLERFNFDELENKIKNIDYLFELPDAIYLCEYLLSKDEILSTQFLYKKCIECLIKYKLVENKLVETKQEPKSTHSKFLFQRATSKNVFQKVLLKPDIHSLLKESYIQIVGQTEDLNFYNRQYIKPDKHEDYELESDDVRNIILDFMSVYFEENDKSEEIKEFLTSEILMFNKLGLYAISINYQSYKKDFLEFLNKVLERDDFIDYLYSLKYEVLSIFESLGVQSLKKEIEVDPINLEIDDKIAELLAKISDENKKEKFLFLHGLKTHPLFKDEFSRLKNEFGDRESSNPKLFFSSPSACFKEVVCVSPVEKFDFIKKTLAEQIDFINTYTALKNRMWDEDEDCYKEENEEGLRDVFKEVLNENILLYLNSEEIRQLKKPRVIGALFESININLSNNILQSQHIEKIINLLNYFVNQISNEEKDWAFHYYLNDVLRTIIKKIENKSQYKQIEVILQELLKRTSNEEKVSNDIASDAINNASGRYWETWFQLILTQREISDENITFFESYFNKEEHNYADVLMFYHLGVLIDHLFYIVKNYKFIDKIKEFITNYQEKPIIKSFLTGFLSYATYIDVFEELKSIILDRYKKADLPDDVYRRFVGLLTDAKFKLNADELFSLFEDAFTEEDQKIVLESLASKDKINTYDKNKVMEYVKQQIQKGSKYPYIIIRIFNLYVDSSRILDYSKDLVKVFKLYESVSETVYSETYLENFLNKLLEQLKVENDEDNLAEIYDIVKVLIPATKVYEYLSSVPNGLKDILFEYRQKQYNKAEENVKLLARDICGTTGLIQYCDTFAEFI